MVIKVIGEGEQWDGWYGRTIAYSNYVSQLDDECYVLICDGRDMLINESFSKFFSKAVKLYNKLIFGTEKYCCAGINESFRENTIDINIPVITHYANFMKDLAKKKNHHLYPYLNYGLMFGKAKDIKKLYRDINIKQGYDDQAKTQQLL